ncbi:hypothetical protein ACVXG7_09245 [Enterobacter hormaechei]
MHQGSHSIPWRAAVVARYHDIGRLVDEAGWYRLIGGVSRRALLSTASYFDAFMSAGDCEGVFFIINLQVRNAEVLQAQLPGIDRIQRWVTALP